MNASSPYVYASFWLRLVAELLDSALLTLASSFIAYGFYGALGYAGFSNWLTDNAMWVQGFELTLYFILSVPYCVYGHYRYGTTLGKRLFGIRVYQYPSLERLTLRNSWIRFWAYGLSYISLCLGFLMAAIHPEKRALHDLVAGTVSLRMRTISKVAPLLACLVFGFTANIAKSEESAGLNYLVEANTALSTGANTSARGEMLGYFGYKIFQERAIFIGPRLGVAQEFGHELGQSRRDLVLGLKGETWLFSAIGIMVGFDLMRGQAGAANGFRIDPGITVRVWHLGDTGAIAPHFGVIWDSRYHYGVRVGLMIQWGGIY